MFSCWVPLQTKRGTPLNLEGDALRLGRENVHVFANLLVQDFQVRVRVRHPQILQRSILPTM